MKSFRRFSMGFMCVCLAFSSYGCFLFGGGKKASPEASLESQIKGELAGKEASAVALQQANQSLEEGNYDNVVVNYNRAIQADSTNVNLYIDLASVYQQLSEIRREGKNVDAALQENFRGLKVLETLVNQRLVPAAQEGKDLSSLRAPVSTPAAGADAIPAATDTTTSAP